MKDNRNGGAQNVLAQNSFCEDGSILSRALSLAAADYVRRNPISYQSHIEACSVLPGGNTRSVLYNVPFPLTIARGHGAELWDVDGHKYVDFLGDHTSALFGHSDQCIRNAIHAALDDGINLGAHCKNEVLLAKAVCKRFPSIELVRFTASGTEANLMAIAVACALQKRTKILVFYGCFHGGVLSFSKGHGIVNVPYDFVLGRFNDIRHTNELFGIYGKDIAAVLVEPMVGAGGCIPADQDFLESLRSSCDQSGAFLVFDEVMTSRLHPGGLQTHFGVYPDLTTLGKYVGGGLPCGAFGGRSHIMEMFDPRCNEAYPHSGTFNNNVLTMAAGLTGMGLYDAGVITKHNARGEELRTQLNEFAKRVDANLQFTGMGSMLYWHLKKEPIKRPEDATVDTRLKQLFALDLFNEGIWISPNGLMSMSLCIDDTHCQMLIESIKKILHNRKNLFF